MSKLCNKEWEGNQYLELQQKSQMGPLYYFHLKLWVKHFLAYLLCLKSGLVQAEHLQ